ncbi:TlpA family protein disulfide reductase [Mongoliitalea daihaiensis]|uniref:TlpA family protein disulfide reductase n=1 Tax=Mongoliitalea daihaiensis TaxID=2782006 RepID=UPI001F39F348|nr:TlpA disulfide reductase family protein [Mongoliitalea daihaiensis]UJP65285.1 TlpA family protein disulfide reductase [Mongoliitalea daihaiensis]
MKKHVTLMMLFFLAFVLAANAQSIIKAMRLSNSLDDLWEKGKIEKAVKNSIDLYAIDKDMFADRIHADLAQKIKKQNNQVGLNYLEQLYALDDVEVNQLIEPMLFWSRVLPTRDAEELASIQLELIQMQQEYQPDISRFELYVLLILQDLIKKEAIDQATTQTILEKNIQRLTADPWIYEVTTDRKKGENRAWKRYMIASSYATLFSHVEQRADYLAKAGDYSPDLNDQAYRGAYFYDALLLTGNTKEIGYKAKYQEFLLANDQEKVTLEMLAELTFSAPTDANMASLRVFYDNSGNEESFAQYWENYIHSKGRPIPRVRIPFETEVLDFAKTSDSWTYVYVWGTWCGPCVKDLPNLQAFYANNLEATNEKLKIYTLSFGSRNLQGFMKKNGYDFPVSEITHDMTEVLSIQGYPTKILISPEGNYVIIPFGFDWQSYLRNYVLL